MKIVVITTSYPETDEDPAGHFVRAEVRALERDGASVRVISPPLGGAFGWPGVAARVGENPLRVAGAARWIVAARRGLEKMTAHPTSAPDRVIAHWSVPSAFPIATKLSTGGDRPAPKLTVVSHGGDVRLLARLPREIRAAIVERIVRRATTWRFVSSTLRDEFLATLRAGDAERVNQIALIEPSPLELPSFDAHTSACRAQIGAIRRDVGARAAAHVGVAVGRLVPGKRIDRIIEHVATDGNVLVVVGDGPERGRLEALAKARSAKVRFLGKVPRAETLAWIAAADVLFHASREEGLSTVIREAAAVGTSVRWVDG